ncbi:hypothetical protein EMPS_09054 [Entomortierella parvispora]|uniref:C3H1-type domain-containing protein n=1 Tax=Entomortierella parvispora TaxID=205924 RepID=A0A9P3HH95_9FUNG|nr:hypothetical protein EMPS_09054 [Entomortierella parvispora]
MGASEVLTIPTYATAGAFSRRKRSTRPIPRALSLVETSDAFIPELSAQESLGGTSMDLGGAVVFSVNPPASPQSSDTYSEDQDAFHRAWCTSYDNPAPIVSSAPRVSHVDRGPAHPVPSRYPEAPKSTDIGSAGDQSNSNKRPQGSRRSSVAENSRKSELYKTELCVSLTSGLPCKYGDQCQFAHSRQELQQVARHPRYKTQLCTSYQTSGYCKYNDRCTFVHRLEESRVPLSILFENSPKQAPRVRTNSGPLPAPTTNFPEPQPLRLRPPKGEVMFDQMPMAKPVDTNTYQINIAGEIHPLTALPISDSRAHVAVGETQAQRQYHHLRSSSASSWDSLNALIDARPTLGIQEPQQYYALPARNEQLEVRGVAFDEAFKPLWDSHQLGFDDWGYDNSGLNEVEWAAQLARFIWTPQNEFHI